MCMCVYADLLVYLLIKKNIWKAHGNCGSVCICEYRILSEALNFESVLCVCMYVRGHVKIPLRLIDTNYSTRKWNRIQGKWMKEILPERPRIQQTTNLSPPQKNLVVLVSTANHFFVNYYLCIYMF